MDGVLAPAPPEVRLRVRYGLEVAPLTVQLMRYFGVPRGLLITSVVDASRGGRTGLRAGDCITSITGRSVVDSTTLLQALDQAPQTPVVSIFRHREELQLKLAQ
jgi:S1-C subfamily serine protease